MNEVIHSLNGCSTLTAHSRFVGGDTDTESFHKTRVVEISSDDVEVSTEAGPYSTVKSLIEEWESDPEGLAQIAEGRRWVSRALYGQGEVTIQSLRLAAGHSQQKLSEITQTSQPYIARIEKGMVDVRMSTARKLADALGVTVVEIDAALRNQNSA